VTWRSQISAAAVPDKTERLPNKASNTATDIRMMILLTETELHHAPALASTTTLTSSEPAINPMAQFFGKKVARKFAIVRVKETEKDAQVRLVKTHKKPNTGTLPDEVMLARTARYNEELVNAGLRPASPGAP
jgi:hypothetical protein